MFEFFLRKTVYAKMNKEDQEHSLLLKDKWKVDILSHLLVYLLGVLPIISFITLTIMTEHTLSNIIQGCSLILASSAFIVYFAKTFKVPIKIFKYLIATTLYFNKCVIHGKAIQKEDFETIQKENRELYEALRWMQSMGYCYSICFDMLQCLKKGTIQFLAIKCREDEKEKNGNQEYTMHVLYVNNGWCFDTYSERQYPLDKVMKQLRAKTYKSFAYEDVQGLTYEEFREKTAEEVKFWCQENNCYQKWAKS